MTSQVDKSYSDAAPAGTWLDAGLAGVAKARVAVFGDFCLDAYWSLDPDTDERSLETGLPVQHVREQRYGAGGAGNVAVNLAALGVAEVRAIGMAGDDLFGHALRRVLQNAGVDVACLLANQPDWQTMVYAKPCMAGRELNRLDFGGSNAITKAGVGQLAAHLDAVAAQVDAVVLNQQMPVGLATPDMIERINDVITRHPHCRFIVDARRHADLYRGAILKLNAHEAAHLLGEPAAPDEHLPHATVKEYARRLARQTGQPIVVTQGERGIMAAEGETLHSVNGIQIIDATDPVGAGDTVAAALAATLGGGCDVSTAIRMANLAASITVRKLQTTGTASPAELRAAGPCPDYIYLPDLAADARQARYIEATEIEQVRPLPVGRAIRHAIFDHDGTLSALREGWEAIMEPMMVRAILGERHDDADQMLYRKVVETVRQFINDTTGIQTLVQMQGLVKLVRQFGCVPAHQILDMHGYKQVYNEALLAMVNQRMARLRTGELTSADFQIKNAFALLSALHAAGVKLYLASGTDEADVIAEAQAMGYADLFEGRIFGAVGDVAVEAKQVVLTRLMRENHLAGPELVTFGDGPVEIRLTHQAGGIAVGVASDEVRRFGLNAVKRSRLIRAGADLIVPDFSQLPQLLEVLGVADQPAGSRDDAKAQAGERA
ncbi:MAG: PfkB family carbohydrate kinase [Phycisphaeraceae bacterium]